MMAFRVNLQWFWLLLYAALILPFAPYVTKPEFFYRSVYRLVTATLTLYCTTLALACCLISRAQRRAAGCVAGVHVFDGIAGSVLLAHELAEVD